MWSLDKNCDYCYVVILYRSEGEEKKGKKDDYGAVAVRFYEWNFIINNIFINEFIVDGVFVSKIS